MAQHFLLSAAARTLSIKRILRMSEDEAHAAFVSIRFAVNDGKPHCISCGHTKVYTIARRVFSKVTGEARNRTLFKCAGCLQQFSVTSGTIFSGRKLAFTDILHAIALFCNGAKGISALQMSRDVEVQYKTAFVLLHKLRQAMSAVQGSPPLAGEIEMDGGYFGGKQRPPNRRDLKVDRRRFRYGPKKRCVVIVRERGGRSMTMVCSEAEAAARAPSLIAPGSVVYTDEAKEYNSLSAFFDHRRVNHSVNYATKGGLHTNHAESFFARLRRAEFGTHHHLARRYIDAYAAESSWREDRRRLPNGDQFEQLVAAGLAHPVSRRWKGYWQRRKADAA